MAGDKCKVVVGVIIGVNCANAYVIQKTNIFDSEIGEEVLFCVNDMEDYGDDRDMEEKIYLTIVTGFCIYSYHSLLNKLSKIFFYQILNYFFCVN